MNAVLNFAALAATALIVGACQTPQQRIAQIQQEIREGKPRWSVACQGVQRDSFGRRIEHPKCWVSVIDDTYRPDIVDRMQRMLVETVAEIDASGPRIVPGSRGRGLCGHVAAPRLGVDGRDITGLKREAQISAVLSGRKLFRESSQPWPTCNNRTTSTYLDGFADAYRDMLDRWQRQS